jgi:hypothetical protein
MRPLLLAFAVTIAGCSNAPTIVASNTQGLSVAASSSFAPAAIAAMKKQLLAEPKVRDLTFNGGEGVSWQIGVDGDGSSRIGFAQYVCQLLDEKHLVGATTDVRVVDLAKLNQSGGDFRGASLGHVRCRDAQNLGT